MVQSRHTKNPKKGCTVVRKKGGHYYIFSFDYDRFDEFTDKVVDFVKNKELDFNTKDAEEVVFYALKLMSREASKG